MTNIKENIMDRVILGLNMDSQDFVSLPWNQLDTSSNRNILIVGKAGSRKSISFVIPNILNQVNSSLVIASTRDDLYQKTFKIKEAQGYDIKVIDYKDASSYENTINTLFTNKLRNKKTALYIIASTVTNYSIPISDLIYSLEKIHSKKDASYKYPLIFFLDEFINLGYIRHYSSFIKNCNAFNVYFCTVLQKFYQLNVLYGKDEAGAIFRNSDIQLEFSQDDVRNSSRKITNDELQVYIKNNGYQKLRKLSVNSLKLKYPGYRIVVIDPQGEYKALVEGLGGQYSSLKNKGKSDINTFELEVEEDKQDKKFTQLVSLGNTELNHNKGILFGRNIFTETPIFYDNFVGAPVLSNPHTFVCGTTGIGKSVFLKLKGSRGANAKRLIAVIDPYGEYKKMVTHSGGQYVSLKPGVKSGINPFELEVEEDRHGHKKVNLYGKRTQIINIMSIFAERFRGTPLKGQEITAIDEVIYKLYSDKGITEDADSLYKKTKKESKDSCYTSHKKKDMPILSELRQGLIKYNEKFKLQNLNELTELMKLITGDGPMAMFDCQSIVNLTKNRIIGISCSYLNDEFTNFFATLNVLSWLYSKLSDSQLKHLQKEVILDEIHLFAKYSKAYEFIDSIAKLGERLNIALTLSTGSISDFLNTQNGANIIKLCATKVLLRQDHYISKQVSEFFGLSSKCRDYISTFVSGDAILLSEQNLSIMHFTPFDYEKIFILN
ncbi:MAG: type IV secretory system conjugative DNA transfer family protein [Clostridium tyrobutyricum]|uniref:type IV secretory system conjugative DNA transfer family protein n=1 Tax=Clostridium tyrobutyricum TaxID=1519 RepID=UPI00164D80AA|nr:type IV secretory system conjugative DNA transfer family protein [Clostridium tyrobutyricum]MCH4236504.1 type IV secretory system conjugative DNA transfer family protein [Clostridium tyrobutyricum]MCH4259476.1 type IV secretory system conjugative DNA transfer family protein [Clostridium tyrobutyricum]